MSGQLENMQKNMMGNLDSEMDKMREKLNDMGNLGGLKDEMAAMKQQLAGLTSGADGLTANMQKEMDAMRNELKGLTAGLHSQLGEVANLKGLKGKVGGPERRKNATQLEEVD